MKPLLIVIVFILFFALETQSQVSGFMGNRFYASYNINPITALYYPSYNSFRKGIEEDHLIALIFRHNFNLEYILTNNHSLGFTVSHYKNADWENQGFHNTGAGITLKIYGSEQLPGFGSYFYMDFMSYRVKEMVRGDNFRNTIEHKQTFYEHYFSIGAGLSRFFGIVPFDVRIKFSLPVFMLFEPDEFYNNWNRPSVRQLLMGTELGPGIYFGNF